MTADLSLPPQASLLGLPSELRVRIYHYLFSSVCAKDDTLRYYIYGSSAHVSHPRDPRLFALRRVCKILRHEVQDIRPPIRDVTFVFYRTTYDDLRRWINNTELSFIQKLRKWEVESSRSKVVLDLARFEQDVAAGMHGFPLSGWSGVYTEVDDIMLDYGYVRRFVRSDDGIWSPDNEVEVILDFTNNYHGLVEPWDTTANVQPDHLLVSFEALYYEEEGISPDHIGNASRVGEVEDVGTTDVTYPRASLLGLPLNIRMRVYEHLFGRRQDNGPHVHLYGSLDPDSRGPPDAHPLGLLGASAKFRRELKSEMDGRWKRGDPAKEDTFITSILSIAHSTLPYQDLVTRHANLSTPM
ncbi:hypothetical protein KC343_g124 [Hortaea werneckii]|nr:hypothetical protein KC352_g1234 [Hortaea werneckii]KAI7573126.1 hypothetical protein KC317_g144 [Hortaea werneckii]KAI7628535.1 hypothetical protein KC346_g120 [Hortaea werneckii]KAI7638350.1 hypothetical protein KC343_g124 [Hortaea werneckii]KAI7683985.1 hypothetical protein KC319_g151 [Hortaea werneckii]